ncbi:YchJ family protein [Klugiella xanthotipulae]
MRDSARCPCLSGEKYGFCCGPLHNGSETPVTAVRLMRSRFSAYAVGNARYLLSTWHPETRPAELELDANMSWYRLDIVAVERGGMLDTRGMVEFRAYFRGIPGSSGRGEQHRGERICPGAGALAVPERRNLAESRRPLWRVSPTRGHMSFSA